jgi:ABC-type dipeptide/oligopeptide/nickel transport system permease subunit
LKIQARIASALLVAVAAASLGAGLLTPASYEAQFRESPGAPPTARFPLGTDELGRDRLARLLYGSRVSLLLAPAAAALSVALSAAIGVTAGWAGGWIERAAMAASDLFVSLPWLYLLLTARALLPLNVSPWVSILITFLLLGVLSWAPGARVIRAGAAAVKNSEFTLVARAGGCPPGRLLWRHVLPNLRPLMAAQFLIAIPAFILSEANLGMLGLGVAEPLPSWGGLLAELQDPGRIAASPAVVAPALLLTVFLVCFQTVFSKEER